MTGEDQGAAHGAPAPAGHAAEGKPAAVPPPPAPTSEPPPPEREPAQGSASEWLASDARGPLNAAGSVRRAEPDADSAAFAQADLEPGPIHADAPATAAADAPVPAPSRRPAVWPLAAALVIGAAVGAGSAYAVYRTAAREPAAPDRRLADLGGRLDALERRPDPQDALASLKTDAARLAGRVAALEARPVASPPAAPQPQAAPADLASLRDKVAALAAAVEAAQRQGASAGDVRAVQGQAADLSRQLAAARGDVQALQAGQASLETRITSAPALAVVADSLLGKIRLGLPYAAEIKALDALGVDPARTAALRATAGQGVASAKTLADAFEPLVERLLGAASQGAPDAGFWQRMKAGAAGLVSVRRAGDLGGDDPASRVARIRADLGRGDVVDALATWTRFAPAARSRPDAEAWEARARASAEAATAAQEIEAGAIATLGDKPASAKRS